MTDEPQNTAEPGAEPETAAAPPTLEEAKPGDVPAVLPAVPAGGKPARYRPSYLFLAVVSIATLAADLASKAWAKGHLEDPKSWLGGKRIEVIPHFMSFIFAKNRGGAWGLLQDESESIRRPFFLGISVLAILFIVSLYRRLTPQQTALKWGLPLVLGGALGNLINRIQYNYVVDFIDTYASWGGQQHHWPTFNVADVAICVGVGLMAIDMFTTRRPAKVEPVVPPPASATSESPVAADPK